ARLVAYQAWSWRYAAGCQPLTPLVFPITGRPAKVVGRAPRSAAGPLAGLPDVDETDAVGEERVPGDPRGPGGPPHNFCGILRTGKTSGIRLELKPAPHRGKPQTEGIGRIPWLPHSPSVSAGTNLRAMTRSF